MLWCCWLGNRKGIRPVENTATIMFPALHDGLQVRNAVTITGGKLRWSRRARQPTQQSEGSRPILVACCHPSVLWRCCLGDRKGIWRVKFCYKSLLFGTGLTWSNSGKMNRLNKNCACMCFWEYLYYLIADCSVVQCSRHDSLPHAWQLLLLHNNNVTYCLVYKLFMSNNTILSTLAQMTLKRFKAVGSVYGVQSSTQSVNEIKSTIWQTFVSSLQFLWFSFLYVCVSSMFF